MEGYSHARPVVLIRRNQAGQVQPSTDHADASRHRTTPATGNVYIRRNQAESGQVVAFQ